LACGETAIFNETKLANEQSPSIFRSEVEAAGGIEPINNEWARSTPRAAMHRSGQTDRKEMITGQFRMKFSQTTSAWLILRIRVNFLECLRISTTSAAASVILSSICQGA
jgi:hypothetical protein